MIDLIKKIREDYALRNYLAGSISLLLSVAFLLYNLFIGLMYRIVWNATICVYYLVLILLRTVIFFCEKKWQKCQNDVLSKKIKLFRIISRLLILTDVAVVIPITLMVLSQRAVNIGSIHAIAIAAYTTYKVTMSIINYRRTKLNPDLSLHALKIINLMDALVSILTLQNTLIMVFGNGSSMIPLTAVSSAGILALMITITILLIIKGKKMSNIK